MRRASTLADYQRRIGHVLKAIEENLDGDLSAERLARIAAFSPYHFHRVFRGMVGESVKQHVKRLRLERAAFRLNYRQDSVTSVALDAGYETHEAFTRAFRKHFGCAPSDYAVSEQAARSRDIMPATPERAVDVRTRPPMRIAYVRSIGPVEQIAKAYGDLFAFVAERGIEVAGGGLGISYDDPVVTDPAVLRFDAAIPVSPNIKGSGRVLIRTVPGGTFAVSDYRGPYTEMHNAYVDIVGRWFPRSNDEPAEAGCLEFYLDDPRTTAPSQLRTEIWVPIARPGPS